MTTQAPTKTGGKKPAPKKPGQPKSAPAAKGNDPAGQQAKQDAPPAPAQAKQGAPPPPAEPNAPVNGAAQQCPLVISRICDVKKLVVTTTTVVTANVIGPPPAVRKLKTTKRRRNEPTKGINPHWSLILPHLAKYDLVIDTMADYYVAGAAPPLQKVEIEAQGEFTTGAACPVSSHPRMVLKPLNGAAELEDKELVKKDTTIGPMKFTSNPAFFDFAEGNDLVKIFDIISTVWPLTNPKLIEIRAESCGVLADNDTANPNIDLLALVRVFRKDTYTLTMKIPPLGKYTNENAGTLGLFTGETSKTHTETLATKFNQSTQSLSDKVTTAKDPATKEFVPKTEHSETVFDGKDGQKFTTTRTTQGGTPTFQSKEERTGGTGQEVFSGGGHSFVFDDVPELKKPGAIVFSLKRNGVELVLGKNLKDLFTSIIKFRDTLKSVIEYFKKAPQLGWKFTATISAFEGSVQLAWGPQVVPTAWNDRYFPIEFGCSLKIAMTIVSISLEASFGVDAMAGGTGVVLKVSGSLSFSVSIEVPLYNSVNAITEAKFPLIVAAGGKLSAESRVSILGWNLLNASVTVTAGFSLANGSLIIDGKGVRLTGTIKRDDIWLTGQVKRLLGAPRTIDPPVQLFKGGPIVELG